MVRYVLVALVIWTGSGRTADAQEPASTFAELANWATVGQSVSVTTRAGTVVKGHVETVSEALLVVRSEPGRVTLTQADVQRVTRQERHTWRGAFIGLAAGAATGALLAATGDDCTYTCFSSPAGTLSFGALFGAVGMGAGALIGSSRHHEKVLFEAPAPRAEMRITPMLSNDRAGVLMRFAW